MFFLLVGGVYFLGFPFNIAPGLWFDYNLLISCVHILKTLIHLFLVDSKQQKTNIFAATEESALQISLRENST